MNFQNIVASLIVLAAAVWLGKRIFGVFRAASGKSPVAGCGTCPRNQHPTQTVEVTEIDRQSDS